MISLLEDISSHLADEKLVEHIAKSINHNPGDIDQILKTILKKSRINFSKKSWLDIFSLPNNLNVNFKKIWELHPIERSEIKIYGKIMKVPRFQKSYMRDYNFSGAISVSDPLPNILKPFLSWANKLGYGEFNQFLLNWYENGENYIGSHADDESQLLKNSAIITITLCEKGDFRTFRIRDIKTKTIVKDIKTFNGIVLVMGGHFQQEFKHEIPKISGSKADKVGKRISITLRQFK